MEQTYLIVLSRSVATHDEIMVPETLLKKRKSQEKERENRAAETEKRRKVSYNFTFLEIQGDDGDDNYPHAASPSGQCCCLVNHLSGLSRSWSSFGSCVLVTLILLLTVYPHRLPRRSEL
jgi:hypothetical protein